MDVSNAKALPNSNNSQSTNDTTPCDWQRALGICGKVDSLTTENAITDFSAAFSSSQTRMLPKSTRLSVHSDDDLGYFFTLFFRNFLNCFLEISFVNAFIYC